ncbi:MAG: ABC transporter permease [Gemmatimonadota bacterium]|nr:ABC transporter permease [Gemmatimonadota bacterium]
MNLSRLGAMARKEWIQLRRDPRSMVLAFVLPLFMVVFFSYAISWDLDNIPVGVVDEDRTPESRALVERFTASGYFRIVATPERPGDAEQLLIGGGAQAVLHIPPGFARELSRGRRAAVQFLLDGSDANSATVALTYADALAAGFTTAAHVPAPPLTVSSRVWYNETLRSRNMIVPGLIAVIMSIIAAMLTALTIAREWERGTMEQLAATPVGRAEVVLGKLVPYLLIGLLDVAMVAAVGVAVLGVPFRGNLVVLFGLTTLFLLGALGLGIFISATIKSQVLATQVAMVVTYLPALLLSGFMFAIANMPPALRAATWLVPARYFVSVTRSLFLKGTGPLELWPQALAMAVFASAGIGLAIRAFRKEIG